MTRLTVAEKLAKEAAAAQARQTAAERADARKTATARIEAINAAKARALKDLPGVLASAKEAAATGRRSYRHSVIRFADSNWPGTTLDYAHALIELLRQKGFKADYDSHREDPFGSDPMFYNTVFDCWVDISW
jgi:membrane protein involved in colicin uptake